MSESNRELAHALSSGKTVGAAVGGTKGEELAAHLRLETSLISIRDADNKVTDIRIETRLLRNFLQTILEPLELL